MFSMNSKSFQSSMTLAIVQGESCTIANSLNYFELLLPYYVYCSEQLCCSTQSDC